MHLLLGLEVVEEDRALLRLLTPVLDNDARAVDDLAGVALAVQDACINLLALGSNTCNPTTMEKNVQSPAHSPSCLPSGILMRGMLCSLQRAITSFL